MKKLISIISLVLSFILILNITAFAESGYAYSEKDLNAFAPKWNEIQNNDTVISLVPGAKAGEMNFGWLSDKDDETASFEISQKADMSDSKALKVKSCSLFKDYTSNNVTASGLEEGKTYYYSYTANGVESEIFSFTVQPDNEFTALFVSDAQIGRSGDENLEEVLIRDTCGWNYTVEKILKAYPDAAFLISGGDQFQSADSLTQMKAYLAPEKLRSLPVANTIGNHDDDSTLYGDIFNNPNEVFSIFKSKAGSGYYYSYGDALFITVDSNSPVTVGKLLKKATEAYPDTKWRVVTMHHNPYSASLSDKDFSEERLLFSSIYDCYDIDLVLSGHDHLYSRTSVMYQGEKTNGEGTVYLQSSSASGSNYDPLPENLASFIVSSFDTRVPTYTALTFTSDAIITTTYRTDTDEIIDFFEVKDNTNNSEATLLNITKSFFKTLFSMVF